MSLRVGVLGAGYFARFHHEAWQRIPGADLVGVADLENARAAEAHVAPFGSVGEMLERARPDLLDIATPPETHASAIRAGMSAGVTAIICQKPFCASLAEAQTVTAEADAAGIPLIIHENIRFQPWYRRMKALLDAGDLGDPHQMTFRLRTGDGRGPGAYLDRQPYFQTMPRLLIRETAVHWIDTFRFLLGPIVSVQADLRRLNPAIRGEDAGMVLFSFKGGVRALFDGNRHLDHATPNPRLTFGEGLLEASAASVALAGDGSLTRRAFGARSVETVLPARDWPGFAGDCVHALQTHVIEALAGRGTFENTAGEYLAVRRIEEAIYAAADTGQRVEISEI